jgi:hypothetical protein
MNYSKQRIYLFWHSVTDSHLTCLVPRNWNSGPHSRVYPAGCPGFPAVREWDPGSGALSYSGTGQGGPISHTRTGQGPSIPQWNRSGALYNTLEQVRGPYPTAEQVRGPIFHTGTGQGSYNPTRNRSGALYPTPEQVRVPISHTGTGQAPNVPHRTGQLP